MPKTAKKPEILLVTRPLTPPWDEASKNFAYLLARSLIGFKFHILVGEKIPRLPKNIIQHQIYRGADWNIMQKTKLVLKLFILLKRNPQIKIIHFIFVPTPFNTKILKNLIASFSVKTVQTIACVSEKNKERINPLLFADRLITYSRHSAAIFSGGDRKKTLVIPPFIDFNEFTPIAENKKRELRMKYRLGREEKIILYPGEYSRLNALPTLHQGFILIKSKIPNAKLLMACRLKSREDQKIEKEFQSQIAKTGLTNSVAFLGRVKNMAEIYQLSDLTVFPVRSMEGKFDFPFVLLESLACGTPILTSDIAALPEIWDSNQDYLNKYIFDHANVSAFAVKSIAILKEKAGGNAALPKYAKQKFNRRKILEAYSKMYSSI